MDTTVITVISIAGTLAVSVIGGLLSVGWWMAHQFAGTKNLIYTESKATQKAILEKLEYHERHDDDRFSAVAKDLLEIRIRNAAVDGRTRIRCQDEPK